MSTDFTLVRNQILFKACRQAGILEQGETPEPEMLETAADYLNTVVKDLEVHKRKLWALESLQVALTTPSVVTNDDVDYYCIKTHTSGATSEPGMGSLSEVYWYAAEVEDTTPATWATATPYTCSGQLTAPDGTTSIESAFIRYDDVDYPLEIINRFKENEISEKWELNRPACLRFDRPNLKIILYPIPDQAYVLFYTRIRLLEDILTAGGELDIPQTLFSYMILETAAWLAEEYQQEEAKIVRLQAKAQQKLALAIRNQVEGSDDTFIRPAY